MNSDVVVVTPADKTALTSLERIRLEGKIFRDADDDLLTAKIAEASALIDSRCWPSLKRETVTETFYTECDDRWINRLILDRFPVVSISEVIVDGGEPLDLSEFRIDSERRRIYRQTALNYNYGWAFAHSAILTYVAGYLLPGQEGRDLPLEIEEACIELVGTYLAVPPGRDPMLRAEEAPGVYRFEYQTTATGYAGDLPLGVLQKLDRYLRKEMVL